MKKEEWFVFLVMIPLAKIRNMFFFSWPLGKNKQWKFLSETANILDCSNCRRSKIANHSSTQKTALTNLLKENTFT